jgi:hypothetical protein
LAWQPVYVPENISFCLLKWIIEGWIGDGKMECWSNGVMECWKNKIL